jgi:protein-S-isoprenylcysteine O-methyltransferase Ste14
MPNGKLNKWGTRVLIGYLLMPVVQGALMFVCAGRTDLPWFWAYLAVSFVTFFGGIALVAVVNPELVNQRGMAKQKTDTKQWDPGLLTGFGFAGYFVAPAVIGLDAGRYQWSHLAVAWAIAGIVLFVIGSAILTWSMLLNKFFETTVRLQTDRDQYVVTDGPYKYVRHPGYAGVIITLVATPLIARSLAGLVPVAVSIAFLVIRTALEDNTLKKELAGYTEYANRTKKRLLPGLW